MDKIAILGLGPIGTSLGMALKKANIQNTEIVGFDRNRRAVSEASKIDAIDHGTRVYSQAVDGAQLIVLDLPGNEIVDTIKSIGPMLKTGSVITDTRATTSNTLVTAMDHLQTRTSFVGGHPLLKTSPNDLSQASDTLFEDVDYCVIPSKSAGNQAVSIVVGMVESVGAKPFFLDPAEHDGYVAAIMTLPALMSYALTNITTSSVSWRDMARFSSGEYDSATRLAAKDPQALVADSISNKDALIHWIDKIIGELHSYRSDIDSDVEHLETDFIRAWENRAKWVAGSTSEDDKPDLPSARDTMASWIFSNRLWDRQKQITNANRLKPWQYPNKD